MQQWANEFHQQHPDITFQIGANQPGETVDLQIISHSLGEKDLAGGKSYVALARYIQLPVVNKERKDLPDLISRGFSDKAIKNIYFAGNTNENSSQEENPFTVYTRSKPACASISFAQHFGHEQKDISGIGVNGDDRDLLTAIKRDINGLSYNNLGFIYNLQTRQVTDSIAIVPIDLNDNGKIDGNEKIYGTIDEVIAFQEKNNHPRIPVEFVYVVYQKAQSKEATDAFINWIITKGQDYNNDYGFLTLNNTQPVK
jgi:phosphate transport system substrate-binding protein